MAKAALDVKAYVGKKTKFRQDAGHLGEPLQSYLVRLAVTNQSDKTMYIVGDWAKVHYSEQSQHLTLDFRDPFGSTVLTTLQFPGLLPIMPGRTVVIEKSVSGKHQVEQIRGGSFMRDRVLTRIGRLTCHIPYSDQPFPRKDANCPSAKTIETWKKGNITRVFSGAKLAPITEKGVE